MKNFITFAILIALGALSPTLVSAQSGSSQGSQGQGMQTGSSSQDTQAMPQDPSAQGGQQSGSQVQGTAASVDQQSKTLTVKDSSSGNDRTFTVSEEDKLKDVKPGDQVSVTPSQDNPMQAEDVQKQ